MYYSTIKETVPQDSFFPCFFATDTLQSMFPPHMSACQHETAAAEKWPQCFQQVLKDSPSHQRDQVLLPSMLRGNIQMGSCDRLLVKFSRESWPSLYVPPALCFILYVKSCICFTRFDSFLTFSNVPWTPRLITLHYTTLSGINNFNYLKQISFLILKHKVL